MKSHNITFRLATSFCVLAVVLLGVGWQGVSHMSKLNRELQVTIDDQWEEITLSHEALRLSDLNSRITLLIFLVDDPNTIKTLLAEREANTGRISELTNELKQKLEPGRESELFAAVLAARVPYVESYKQALGMLLIDHKPDDARKMMVEVVRPKLVACHDAWSTFDQNEAGEISQIVRQNKIDYVAGQREFLFTLIVAGLMTGAIAVYTVLRLSQEIAVRRRAEESLQQAHDQLEQRVRDRTADLHKSNQALQEEMVERKRATGQLDRIFALSPDIIFTAGFDGFFKQFNPTLEKLLGYSREELLAESFLNFTHPDEHTAVAETMERIIKTGMILEFESRFRCKDGSYKWIQWNAVAVPEDQMINGTGRDVTERKRIEVRMFQSQKMETVGKLAGGVAHEFNSILTAIIGQSELLIHDLPQDNALGKGAREIRKAADRAAVLTRQLLAYGRKQILQPEVLDLNRVLTDMSGTLQHLVGRQINLRLVPTLGLKMVKIDPSQMEQVIVNIVMNAAEAMPHGGKLTIETTNVELDEKFVRPFPGLKVGNYVMLAITDTGVGMTEEVKARVFEPFFSTKGVGQGTGLGLATCYGILKQSEGHINVYSELARGATFKVYLPQVEAQATCLLPRIDSPDLPRGTETILLAEDDPSLLEMSATLLRRLGYTVVTAVNGVDALSLKNQQDIGHVDLLLTDVVMPHMSGKELSDRIRVIYPYAKILFTSAYTENAIVHQGVLNEGVTLLQKPFTPSALAHKVREILDRSPPA